MGKKPPVGGCYLGTCVGFMEGKLGCYLGTCVSFMEGKLGFGLWFGEVKSMVVGKKDSVKFMEEESYGWASSYLSRPGGSRRVMCRTCSFFSFWSVQHPACSVTHVHVEFSFLG